MVALDVLGRRGALRVLWELRDASLTFRSLQAASDMNPASLNKRIKELRELEIIGHSGDGYHLTKHGRSLVAAFGPLQAWAETWARQVDI
jgi:DNA-binding HxlR family transcriptional regulator